MAPQLEVTTGRPQISGSDDTALLEAPLSSSGGGDSRVPLPLHERSRPSACIDTRDLRGAETRRTTKHRLLAIAVACIMVGYGSTRLTAGVRLLLLLSCKRACCDFAWECGDAARLICSLNPTQSSRRMVRTLLPV